MNESADLASTSTSEVDLILQCEIDQVVLEVREHDSGAVISQWSRTWVATGDDGSAITELDPHVWWNAFGECWLEARTAHSAAEVLSLAVRGGDEVLVCIGADGEPLRPALCGSDPRMEPDAKWLVSQLPEGAADWERITGSVPTSAQMVAKCSWLHRSEADLWNQIDQLLPLAAWMAGKLTSGSARPVITEEMARSTGFWSVNDGAYSRLICQIIDSKGDLTAQLPTVASRADSTTMGVWNGISVSCG